MFKRIINSSKVHVAFGGLVAAVLVAATNGALNEETAMKLAESFLSIVIPSIIVATGIEDHGKKGSNGADHG